jgi:hypothetical protein
MSKPAGESVAHRSAAAAAVAVFLPGAIIPIWPVVWIPPRACIGREHGPLLDSVQSALSYVGVLPLNQVIRLYGDLPPMVGGLVVLSALAGVLTYRWMARWRSPE